jgi:hypothetical protein
MSDIVLTWETIIDTLLESDFLARNGGYDDGAVAAHLVRTCLTIQFHI